MLAYLLKNERLSIELDALLLKSDVDGLTLKLGSQPSQTLRFREGAVSARSHLSG